LSGGGDPGGGSVSAALPAGAAKAAVLRTAAAISAVRRRKDRWVTRFLQGRWGLATTTVPNKSPDVHGFGFN
jgi:hypothetical protein